MFAELSIIPIGRETHSSGALGRVQKIINESGIPYRLTPSGACLEGSWDEVMELAKKCHAEVRSFSTHVLTTVRVEDELGATDRLNENFATGKEAGGRVHVPAGAILKDGPRRA